MKLPIFTIESHPATGVLLRAQDGSVAAYVYNVEHTRLLAHAPDLYAALHLLLSLESGVGPYYPDPPTEQDRKDALEIANAALKKAWSENNE